MMPRQQQLRTQQVVVLHPLLHQHHQQELKRFSASNSFAPFYSSSFATSTATSSSSSSSSSFTCESENVPNNPSFFVKKEEEEATSQAPEFALPPFGNRTKKRRATLRKTQSSGSVPRKKKNMSNEIQRNAEIKRKIKELERSLQPFLLKRSRASLPRIRTLRLTKAYIEHLNRVIKGESKFCGCLACAGESGKGWRPLRMEDFNEQVEKELGTINSYKQRAAEELTLSDGREDD